MLPSEDPPGPVSTILMSYDKVKEEDHPVTISFFAERLSRAINYTVKVPLTIEELKQALRTSMKSGRKYDYEDDFITVSLAASGESTEI